VSENEAKTKEEIEGRIQDIEEFTSKDNQQNIRQLFKINCF
jgi:hypothetical protein